MAMQLKSDALDLRARTLALATSAKNRPAPILYSGPATPTAYDPNWRKYTNLTPAQIAAFKAMPETCQQAARNLRYGQVLGMMPKITPDMTLTQVQAAFDAAKASVAGPYGTESAVLANIGKTIKTQDDVTAAFKAA